jgi:hypothetical protein
MIELAKDAIREFAAAQRQRAIVPATGADVRSLNGHPR